MAQVIDSIKKVKTQTEVKIEREISNCKKYREKMSQNYIAFFQEDATDLFKAEFLLNEYKEFLNFLDQDPNVSELVNYLMKNINMLTNGFLRGRLTSNTISQMHNIAYSLEMECKQEILKTYSTYWVLLDGEGAQNTPS